ncbi:hypothetical protein K503DRAFT_774282 [Rhizopogon vinicolor AM-OR11-026]|uniref:Pheromone n=1 Tax=Rhizopogon vinicolor AM-OR11-026 TaxID=1314800 RepID=A0A1B7MQ06_9AGAM|nr:hypothetical protein K503DRAFT_774282 [Rhizopogon vinicolor AM-OR11-026]
MDAFDTILVSELFQPDPPLSLDQGSCSSDDEPYLLVDADTKWNYGGYCVIS